MLSAGVKLLLLLVAVTAQAADKATTPPPAYQQRQASLTQPDCRMDNCPRFKVGWVAFKDDPELSAWIETQLEDFATASAFAGGCGEHQASVQDMVDHYFPDSGEARPGCAIFAKVKHQQGHVLVLVLDGNTGSLWLSRTLDYDRNAHRGLALDDLLVPGARDRFFALFTGAQAVAFDANSTDCPWPRPPGGDGSCVFPQTEQFEFTAEGLAAVYQLPPRVPGGEGTTMQFLAPYAQLKNILKPEWMPAGP